MDIINSTKGKHFKVYNNKWNEVLEHPGDNEEVNLSFKLDELTFEIIVTGYVHERMRIPGQKERIDLYIMQEDFRNLLFLLEEKIDSLNVEFEPLKNWRFKSPIARMNRQGVPNLKKLAEISGISALTPFENETFTLNSAHAVIDSEIPGIDQTKWKKEGASRQIHIGIFGGNWKSIDTHTSKEVKVIIPTNELKCNFIHSIKKNWVD